MTARNGHRRLLGAAALLLAWLPTAAAQDAPQPAQPDQETAAASRTADAAQLARAPAHSTTRAALASLEAARSQLRAARSPVRFEVSSALTRLDVDDIDLDPITPGVQPLDRTLINVS